MLHDAAGDVRLALRSLRGSLTITAAAVATLALGIGATTAIFSVANALMLRPLPVAAPERLATITSATALRFGFEGGIGWNFTMWDQLRQRLGAFDGGFAWMLQRVEASEGGEAQPLTALVASGELFDVLGVHAIAGRTFTPADDAPGGGRDGGVAVISETVWQRRFGRAPGALGSRIAIDGVPLTVVGVTSRRFRGVDVGQPFDVAMPFGAEALVHRDRSIRGNQQAMLLTVMLRLRRGQGLPAATAALRAMQPQIVGTKAPRLLSEPFVLMPASRGISDRSQLRQRYERPLLVLTIVSALTLAIVCVNIANLLLVRAAARRYEVSVRQAVGAPRWRVARQVLVEAMMLGACGAAAGALVAAWVGRALVAQLPGASAAVSIDRVLDWRVLAFATVVTLLAVLFFGTAPALYAARVPPAEALHAQGRAAGGESTGWSSLGLVVLQVALSMVLLAAAGLFIQTYTRLAAMPLGFDSSRVFVVSVATSRVAAEPAARGQLYDRVRDAAAAIPGIAGAAGSMWTPVGSGGGGLLTDARGRRADVARQVAFNFVTPRWFALYGTTMQAGRDFDGTDGPRQRRVAIVNDAYRRGASPQSVALGDVIHAGPCGGDGCTLVGIVGDTVYGNSLRDAPPPTVYVPLAQASGLRPEMPFRLSIRTDGDHDHLARDVGAALNRVDPRLTYTLRPLADDLQAAVSEERLVARLAALFGAVALLLSSIGLYGVTAYSVTRRRREIGVRLALGAQPREILGAVFARITLAVLAGTLAGVLAALWLGRFVAPLLFGVGARDPVTLVLVTVVLATVAVFAGWRPAARALRVDPAQVLRHS
jgi:predicted permease